MIQVKALDFYLSELKPIDEQKQCKLKSQFIDISSYYEASGISQSKIISQDHQEALQRENIVILLPD